MNLDIQDGWMTWKQVDQAVAKAACPAFEPVGQGGRVPWNYDNSFQLARFGIEVVTPMPVEYDYPIKNGRYPREHQIQGADFLAANHRGYLFMGAGTGKTLTAAWAFDYLIRRGIIKNVLVITTLSTIYSAWGNDLDENLPHLRYKILVSQSPKTRKRLFKSRAPIHIINHDGAALFWKDLQVNDYDLIVLDESTCIKNPKTRRFMGMTSLKHACHNPRVWQMTATPTAQSPEDAYGQILFAANVNHEGERCPPAQIVGPSFMTQTQWKEKTMHRISVSEGSKWVPKRDANQSVFSFMRPVFSRRTRDVLKDLPPEIALPTPSCQPTTLQKKAWKDLRSAGCYEQDGNKATVSAPIATLSKVLQVASGFLYGDTEGYDDTELEDNSRIGERPVMRLGNKSKNEELVASIREAEGKTVVYVPFTAAVVEVDKYLKSQGFKTIRVYGSLSPQEVHKRVNLQFQSESPDSPQVLVAQPEKISHGITATAASLIVWYGPIMRGEVYQQANMRLGRIGQKRVQYIKHLAVCDTERERYNQLKANHNRQQDFMALYESFQRGVT